MSTLYIKLRSNVPKWKAWLMNHSKWYKYNIVWKQPVWIVYDSVNKRNYLPGGTTWARASTHIDRIEDMRKNLRL